MIEEGLAERGISESEVKGYANKINGKLYETSAKTGRGIDDLFLDIAESYVGKVIRIQIQLRDCDFYQI